MSMILSEQEQQRRQSLAEIYKMGINPYPPEAFEVSTSTQVIIEKFEQHPEQFAQVSIAGRIMSRRIMGAASFVELQDSAGRIQLT